jgi:acyl carrier protein
VQDVIEETRTFIKHNFMLDDATAIPEDASFMETHVLDSTGFIELIGFIEERYGVQVLDEEMLPENFDSLRNIEGYLRRKLAATPG